MSDGKMVSLTQWIVDLRDSIARLELCEALGWDVSESKDHLRKVYAQTVVKSGLAEELFRVDAPTIIALAEASEREALDTRKGPGR